MSLTVRIAVQKSGRLSEKSFKLLERCGVEIGHKRDKLLIPSRSFPVEFMLVRDDDIPEFVRDGVCDLGIVGRNVIAEKLDEPLPELRTLEFGYCRLSLAAAKDQAFSQLADFQDRRIATSYPNTLKRFLNQMGILAKVIEITGSVEIAPTLDIADGICDLVSSGATLQANGLKEIFTIMESQAVLVAGIKSFPAGKQTIVDQLLQRFDGVLKAQKTKYVMMNAPEGKIDEIKNILPGMEDPTIVPLTSPGKVAIHAVAQENIFWETIARLKALGASSILVTPIEKIID